MTKKMNEKEDPATLTEAFKILDADGSGSISREEMRTLMLSFSKMGENVPDGGEIELRAKSSAPRETKERRRRMMARSTPRASTCLPNLRVRVLAAFCGTHRLLRCASRRPHMAPPREGGPAGRAPPRPPTDVASRPCMLSSANSSPPFSLSLLPVPLCAPGACRHRRAVAASGRGWRRGDLV